MPLCKDPITGNDISVHIAQQSQCGQMEFNPVFDKVRRTSGKPERTISYTQSAETKSNRQAREQIKESEAYESTVEFELSDMTVRFLENAFYNTFSTFINYTAPGSLSTVAATNTILDSNNGFTDVQVGQWIFFSDISDFNFPQGGVYVVGKVSDGEITVAQGSVFTDTAGVTATIKGTTLTTGKEEKPLVVQKRTFNSNAFEDQTDFETYYDAQVGSLTLTVPPSGIMTGTLALTARSSFGQGKVFGQTDAVDNSDGVASSCDGLDGEIIIDYQKVIDEGYTEFSLELNNNLQSVDQAGLCGPGAIASGSLSATGTLNRIAFKEGSSDQLFKYYNGTREAVTAPVQFPDGKKFYITICQAVLTEATLNDAADEIVQTSGTYAAEEGPMGWTVQVDLDFDPSLV